MPLPRYTYTSLNGPDEIRVLKISPNQGRIEVSVLHVAVTTFPFRALSYVWGDPEHAHQATVLDHLGFAAGWIPLTKNLGNALCDLRGAEGLQEQYFWIDQICINQQDNREKNQQVAMMSEIYTQAKQVITYLGPAGTALEEKRGTELLNRITKNIPKATWRQMHEAGSIERIRDWILEDIIQMELLPSDLNLTVENMPKEDNISKRYIEQGWDWLIHVAYSEWTQRLWIVQEQVLNKEITTLRGHRLIEWDAIATVPILFAIRYLPQQYRDLSRKRPDTMALRLDDAERTIYGIWWDRHARSEHEAEYTWSSLCHNLQWYQPVLCRDARDRVYAILAISEDAVALGLRPDYSDLNSAEILSKELSSRVLATGYNLEFLSFSLSWRQPNSTLPSWCLDLSRPVGVNAPGNIPVEVYTPHPVSFCIHPVRFSGDGTILVAKGRILDCVSTANNGQTWDWNPHDEPLQLEYLHELINLLSHEFSLGDVSSILRTITARAPWSEREQEKDASGADGLPGSNDYHDTMAFYFWAYLRHLMRPHMYTIPPMAKTLFGRCERILENIKILAPDNMYPLLQFDDATSKEESGAVTKILEYELVHGRCFGRTDGGRFYNAIHTVQEGDKVIALQGADQLYVVRLAGTAYKLIGDVYVYGLMQGEAYKDVDPMTVDHDIELA
ncbi:HET-domain-containing protein [Decorospora gaudefroyi]|uniref:HET-domain-containing protein n=1 Tax=Decorospora gaudefroyi TaxID=184978 RepID=A0A6A5K401_9PLEO|nr:HET-domain-containing protein [Decorospora gaudefroyi]